MTLKQLQIAVAQGLTVHWKTESYSLKFFRGDWWVVCINGHIAPLKGHKPEDFFLP